MSSALVCTKCQTPAPHGAVLSRAWFECPGCRAKLRMFVFPALARPHQGTASDITLEQDEATCFYHTSRKAAVACESCGRFLCSLCDVELSGAHLCPACVSAGKKKGRLANLENRRMRYDSLALIVAGLPVALVATWMLTIFTAPAAMYIAIRYWNAPGSLLGRSRIRFIFAIILAALQIVAWIAGITYLVLKA